MDLRCEQSCRECVESGKPQWDPITNGGLHYSTLSAGHLFAKDHSTVLPESKCLGKSLKSAISVVITYPIGSMYGIYANIGGILMGSMAHHIYNYQYICIAAPLGSVMGNLQKETLIFPFLALEKSQAVGETPGFSHPFSRMDWHRLTPRIHGIYADGWRKGQLCRQDRRCGWASFVFESAWNRPGQPAQQKGYLTLKWEDSKDM